MSITPIELAYYKKLRKEMGSIIEVSKKINTSSSFLYDIESKRRSLTLEVFEKITNFCNVNYDKSSYLYNEGHTMTMELFKYTVKTDRKGFFLLYSKFENELEILAHSKAYIFVDLIKSMRYIQDDKFDESERYLLECRDYIDLYDNNIIFINVILWMFTKDIEKSSKDLRKILIGAYDKYSLTNVDSYIKGMLYYQIGRLLQIEKDYFEADKFFDKAVSLFKINNLLNRVIQVYIQKATNYMEVKLYDKAEELYLEMYNKAKENNFTYRLRACCDNLTLLYFVNYDYDKSEKFYKLSKKYGSTFPDIDYYHAYIIYKTKPLKQARTEIAKLISSEEDKRILLILKFIQSMMNENNQKVERYFDAALKESEKIKDSGDLEILNKMALEYYITHDKDKFDELFEKNIIKYNKISF